ncbi:ABC transporter substrate-binding protein [Nonomuraea sp. NPDC046570]|uniref:peptide ABC transporter substrate-binding protein n=1 Tax=Nonomuraea sp. NPDC046570 TaxID=3155255 RepID=UPI0033CCD741
MRVTKGAQIVAGTALLALAVAACGGGGGGTEQKASGGAAASPVRVYIAEPQHELSPINTNDTSGAEVLNALFVGLVDYDKDKNPILKGAESIEPDAESKVWTIKLKDGFKFHNGDPVTAQSYVDAWNAAAYGPNAYEGGYFFSSVEGYEDVAPADPDGPDGPTPAPEPKAKTLSGLKVVDDKTFVVTLARPYSGFKTMLGYTTFMPMPKAAFGPDGKVTKEYGESPIGNGPFKMAKPWKRGSEQSMSLVRYDDYVEKAKIDAVEFKIYTDANTAWNDLRAGNLDIMDQLPPEAIATAKQELGDRYIEKPSSGIGFLGFNIVSGDKYATNPELRKAIGMAIDRKTITETIFSNTRVPADDFISPVVGGYQQGGCGEACTYDPAKAKALWEKAGGGKANIEIAYNADASHKEWIEAVANNLRQNLGVEATPKPYEKFALIQDDLDVGKVKGAFRMAWIMDYPSMENYLRPIFGTGGSSNYGRYSNKDFDKALTAGDSAKTQEEGNAAYRKGADMIAKDLPYLPIYFYQTNGGYSQNVKSVTIDPFERVDLANVERAS